MSKRPLIQGLSLAAVLAACGLPVLAQTTTTETTTTETTTAAPAEDLSMGAEAGAAPTILTKDTAAVGQGYLAANFDAWEERCEKTADGKDPCQLFQLLRDADNNPVAEFSVFPLPKGGKAAAGATVVAPLETLLTPNLTIAIDSAPAKIYPFTFCAQMGCVARVGFTAEEVAQFKKGAKATVTIVPAIAPDQPVNLAISLKGFTAGFDAVVASLPQ